MKKFSAGIRVPTTAWMRASISCMSRLAPDRSAISYSAWRRRSDLRMPSMRDCARAAAIQASTVLRASASQPSRSAPGSDRAGCTTSAMRVASSVQARPRSWRRRPARWPASIVAAAATAREPDLPSWDAPVPNSGSSQPTATAVPGGSVRASKDARPASPDCSAGSGTCASPTGMFTAGTPSERHNAIRRRIRQPHCHLLSVCPAMSLPLAAQPTALPLHAAGFTCAGAGLTLLPVNEAAPASDPEPSDEALMLAYAGGDVAAFEALYGRHRLRLYRFLLRQLRDPTLADELFQDVWQKLIAARESWTPEAAFATWLYRIAHNRLTDHWRALRHRPPAPADADERTARVPD